MNKFRVVVAPDAILQKKAEPVTKINKEIQDTLENMLELMYKANGIGLAAPQVGISKRLVVIDTSFDGETGKNPMFFINPEIIEVSKDMNTYNEGCLSLPNIFEDVERPATCTVKALDFNGKEFTMKCDGILATCVQHEIDHLNGTVFVDHLSRLKRNRALTKLEKSKRRKEFSKEIFNL